MSKKTTSKHQKDLYKSYQVNDVFAKNRLAKLKRRVKKFPNDIAAATLLRKAENGNIKYRRKKSHNKIWSSHTKLFAQQLASHGNNGRDALLTCDELMERYKRGNPKKKIK